RPNEARNGHIRSIIKMSICTFEDVLCGGSKFEKAGVGLIPRGSQPRPDSKETITMLFRVQAPNIYDVRPTPQELHSQAERSLGDALARGDVTTAKGFINPSNPLGYVLTNEQRLEFLQQLDVDASDMMKTLLKDPNCFTPNINSRTFSEFWVILDTRPFIRALITLATLCEEMGEYQLAYDYDLRILTYNFLDNNGVRTNFNLLQTLLGRDLEAYNFCCHLLDEHLDWNSQERNYKGQDYPRIRFNRFKKEDIDPQDPTIYGSPQDLSRADASIFFTGALVLFKMFGPCPKATSWLATGHRRNSHILPILLHPDAPSYPKKRMLFSRAKGTYIEAVDYVTFTKKQFCAQQVQAWLRLASSYLPRRQCDSPRCGKIENFLGEWRRCTGCYETYYCGSECQKEHWKLPGDLGHKKPCKDIAMLRLLP
ncbi:1458_t:CDS:2, partial [Acaulospora colombiana]